MAMRADISRQCRPALQTKRSRRQGRGDNRSSSGSASTCEPASKALLDHGNRAKGRVGYRGSGCGMAAGYNLQRVRSSSVRRSANPESSVTQARWLATREPKAAWQTQEARRRANR